MSLSFTYSACKQTATAFPTVKFSKNDKTIEIKGIDYAAISQLQPDSSGRLWQNLVPVYKMPADTELAEYQPVQPGKYKVNGNSLVFTPDTPFKKSQPYFVRYYRYKDGVNVLDVARGNKKLGQMPYTDLIFKY